MTLQDKSTAADRLDSAHRSSASFGKKSHQDCGACHGTPAIGAAIDCKISVVSVQTQSCRCFKQSTWTYKCTHAASSLQTAKSDSFWAVSEISPSISFKGKKRPGTWVPTTSQCCQPGDTSLQHEPNILSMVSGGHVPQKMSFKNFQ